MHEPHPLYVYGPMLFVAGSCLTSALASPLWMRLAHRRFGPLRRPLRARLIGLVLTVLAFWGVGSLAGLLLLAVPASEREGRLPGDHVDAAVLAHMVPTMSAAACDRLVRRLEAAGRETRWDPPGAREARIVLAARIDRAPERAIDRLVKNRFRTHAGRFALAKPSGPACNAGLDALAEAVQGGALKDLMVACQNAPGDPIGLAAFKMGDFRLAVGPETESILSRQPRAPINEPSCYAEGPEIPDASMPMCRLEHAELHKQARRDELEGLELHDAFAKRWLAALRVELGGPLETAWTIDPLLLLDRPFVAVMDEPISVFEDIRQHATGSLTPAQSAYVRLAIAAERSAMGRHEDAMALVQEAFKELAIGSGGSVEEHRNAARLTVAIGLRAHRDDVVEQRLEELEQRDPLRHAVFWARGHEDASADDPPWSGLLAESSAPAIAAALDADGNVTKRGLGRLARVKDSERPVLREWLREAFPACQGCGFFAQLERLTTRLDGAAALGDEKLSTALSVIVARFEAVFLNRLLALSLRAADPELTGSSSGAR